MTDLTAGAKALIQASRRVPCEPSEEAIERMERAVLLSVGVTATAAVTGIATTKAAGLWSAALGKGALMGSLLLLGGAVGAGTVALIWRSAAPVPDSVSAPIAEPVVGASPGIPAPISPVSPVARAPGRSQKMKVRPAPTPVQDPSTAVKVSPTPVTAALGVEQVPSALPLGAEVAMLRAVMGHLDAHQWPQALAQLERHQAQFPDGALRDEAQVLRVLTLCGLAQVAPAEALASELRARAPSLPALGRLSSSCVDP